MVIAVTAWLVVRAFATITLVSFSFAAAVLLAALMYPLTRGLSALGLPRWAAALLTVLILLMGLFGSVFLVVLRAMSQIQDLQAAVQHGAGSLQKLLTGPPLSLSQHTVQQAQQRVLQASQHALPSPMSGVSMLLQLASGAVLVVFLLFFLLKNGADMWHWVVGWVTAPHRDTTEEAGHRAWQTLTSYVRGTVAVAFIDAIGIGAAMFFLGNPLTASLTLITFIGAFVPIVGATVSGVVAVGVTLVTVGPWAAIILVGAVIAVQQLEGNLLQPLIMGRALQLSPVVIVLTVSAGVILGGILGAIVAVPVVAVVYRVVSFLAGRDTGADESEDVDAGADAGSEAGAGAATS